MSTARAELLKRALRLEYLTVGWNVIEAVVAIGAGLAANSAAVERLDRRAHKLVAGSLFALAAYVTIDAGRALWMRDQPEASMVGIALTTLSMLVMAWLAQAKHRAAALLKSRALEADSFQTSACWWLSVIALTGMGLNAVFGWWWADPIAGLVMVAFILKEAREGWRGADCCC